MRRQFVSAAAIVLALALVAPSVDAAVEAFGDYTLDWKFNLDLFTWPEEQPPNLFLPPECKFDERPTVTEIDKYPTRMEKDKNVTLGGYVKTTRGEPVVGTRVDVFLNATKTEPGILMGSATTDAGGRFTLTARVPVDAEAQKYHLVNYADELIEGCVKYHLAWSDPEVGVYAGSVVTVACPERVFDGRAAECQGEVKDNVGAAVPNRPLDVVVDGRPVPGVVTDARGTFRFTAPVLPRGEHAFRFVFKGDGYYQGGETTTKVRVTGAELQLEEQRIVRGEVARLGGVVVGPPDVAGKSVRVTLTGVPVVPADCAADCRPLAAIDAEVGAEGAFGVSVTSSREAAPVKGTMTVSGPFLHAPKTVPVLLVKGTTLTLDAPRLVGEKHTLDVEGRLVDDTGAPIRGRAITLHVLQNGLGPALTAETDADGVARWEVRDLARGSHMLAAKFPGTDTENVAAAEEKVRVVLPWYVWALGVLAIVAASVMTWWARRLWMLFNPPPPMPLPALAFTFAEPPDAAPETIAPGEAVTVELPAHPGVTALRVHAGASFEGPAEAPLAADAATQLRLTAVAKGDEGFRVVGIDADGREIAEARVPVRVVHYAEEVEREYRDLVRERIGRDAGARVTPRQVEAFLLAGRPHIARDTLARLVSIFEVADYSEHALTRADYLAFAEARRAILVSELTAPSESEPEPGFSAAGVSAHPA